MAAGHPCALLRLGKAQALPNGHRRQEVSEDFFAGLELQSGYALPPFQAGEPRLTLIDAGVSSCLSRRNGPFDAVCSETPFRPPHQSVTIQEKLALGTVVVSDALSCFGAVQQAGVHSLAVRDRKWPAKRPASRAHLVNTTLGNVKRSFHGTYHTSAPSICRATWPSSPTASRRRFSLRELFPRLAFVALRTVPMPYRVLKLAENYFLSRMSLVRNQEYS